MINIIYGSKGTGKTKRMIEAANASVKTAPGHVIFITDTKRYAQELQRAIRFIDCKDYFITGEQALYAFVEGVVAGNYDNTCLYIDGIARIAGKPLAEMGTFFGILEKVAQDMALTITLSCSCEKEDLPDFIAKYL